MDFDFVDCRFWKTPRPFYFSQKYLIFFTFWCIGDETIHLECKITIENDTFEYFKSWKENLHWHSEYISPDNRIAAWTVFRSLKLQLDNIKWNEFHVFLIFKKKSSRTGRIRLKLYLFLWLLLVWFNICD